MCRSVRRVLGKVLKDIIGWSIAKRAITRTVPFARAESKSGRGNTWLAKPLPIHGRWERERRYTNVTNQSVVGMRCARVDSGSRPGGDGKRRERGGSSQTFARFRSGGGTRTEGGSRSRSHIPCGSDDETAGAAHVPRPCASKFTADCGGGEPSLTRAVSTTRATRRPGQCASAR